ncbi:MAG: rhomboid family intramembrane serine protease [Luteolibacter sp.]
MNAEDQEDIAESELPIWARGEAFPIAGEGYGWVDRKGGKYSCSSLDELSRAIREDKDSVLDLVWTPDSKYCRIPEEIDAFSEDIAKVREGWAREDLLDANHRMKWFGGGVAALLAWMAFQAHGIYRAREQASGLDESFFAEVKWIITALSASTTVGISLLVFLVFAFIPWYQAQKRSREMQRVGGARKPLSPLIRFETWLHMQKAPVTWAFLGVLGVVFLAQILNDRSIIGFHDSVNKAGLVKGAYRGGDYWRLLTAPMLHGGVIHFVMNGLGLLYLGKRLEVFARWPHLAMVFLFSALVGGEASVRFMQEATSVGASGGLMGWLGFLLVFETLHSKLVPKSSRRRLIGGVVMTALIGLVGYRFIDNAAHFGGLFAGMAYAAIVFPKSGSVLRPRMTLTDRVVGTASLLMIVAAAFLAVIRIAG